jgi:CRISPR system Cascade subunit CasA
MNILEDPIFTVSGRSRLSLSSLFAGLARGEIHGMTALRPHQRPAWHMFLVQLGALALWTARRQDPPGDAAEWAALLRGLTPDHADDAPWRLVVADRKKPAFLQSPFPDGLKETAAATPDALDMLITARNHDLKQTVARQAVWEDWVFALVSLQTSEGYGGAGNYGIARMNGGSSSRPMLGLAPARAGDQSISASAWWARDVGILLFARASGQAGGIGPPGGPALLWLLNWPDEEQLDLRTLDPWFIEVCRRVRLIDSNGDLSAIQATSKATRIDSQQHKGNVGDPWAPVHRTEHKSFTISGSDFTYKKLNELLFSGDWEVPLLAQPAPGETDAMLLVAEALARGNSKTEGFKSRIVLVPGDVSPFMLSESAAALGKVQIDEITTFDKALRDALVLVAVHGERESIKQAHYAFTIPARNRFDREADRLFFPSLWRRLAVVSLSDEAVTEVKNAFLSDLLTASREAFEAALPAIPCTAIHRPRAEARARRSFFSRVRSRYPELFKKERADVAA